MGIKIAFVCLNAHLFKTKQFFHVHLLASSEYSTVRTWGGLCGERGIAMLWPSLSSKPQSLTLLDAKKLTKAISDCNNSLQN